MDYLAYLVLSRPSGRESRQPISVFSGDHFLLYYNLGTPCVGTFLLALQKPVKTSQREGFNLLTETANALLKVSKNDKYKDERA